MVLLGKGLCQIPTSTRFFHCTRSFVPTWFKPNHLKSFSMVSFYFRLGLPVFLLTFIFNSYFLVHHYRTTLPFWDYVVFKPMSILKRVLFTALPFPDQKFKEAVDNGDKFGALLTFLYKEFHYIDPSLLLAKLYWFGVSNSSLNLNFSYFDSRTQHAKINNCFISASKI